MIRRSSDKLLSQIIQTYGKMAFLSGPRQVGKTTLAKDFQKKFAHSIYVNWDKITDQKLILTNPYFFDAIPQNSSRATLVVLDEIHKYARWKNYLKGAYDTYQETHRFLVTGSGRLDVYKKGGDSLLGRYFSVPLYPLSLGELSDTWVGFDDFLKSIMTIDGKVSDSRGYEHLFKYSGFPEPFQKRSESFYNTWSSERKTLLIREDIRDASRIREISLLEHLTHLLPDRIGSPLSINVLKQEVGVAFESVRDWIKLLESFYYLFRLTPYTGNSGRTLKKESKVYLYDWGEIGDEAIRFENIVAFHLYKSVKLWEAMGESGRPALHFIRDKEKREVDFVITKNNKPACLIECKFSDEVISQNLLYYQKMWKTPIALQLIHKPNVDKMTRIGGMAQRIVSADKWLRYLL